MLIHSVLVVVIFLIELATSVNIAIRRRGGRLATNQAANLTYLTELLTKTEHRYSLTYRAPRDNHLVRRWCPATSVVDDEHLFHGIGDSGFWYATIPVGQPPQYLEFDLDMLGPDFYTAMTTSGAGSKYDTFFSQSHASDHGGLHPMCNSASDHLKLGDLDEIRLELPICTPPKTSELTLLSSGSVIGLAPPNHLTRIPGSNLVERLQSMGLISIKYWSLTVLDAENGVLCLGSTIAKELEAAKIRAEVELHDLGQDSGSPGSVANEVKNRVRVSMPDGTSVEEHFKWANVQGAAGWWTALMSGVWINGAKVVRNQPVIFDVQSPFILAPPSAVAAFYTAVGGSFQLPAPHERFFAVPCLNTVNVALEIAGWNFPIMSGETTRLDALHGPAGGRFSLGKMANNTGYCIGSVVETRMEQDDKWDKSGLKGTWVLGELFFRGMGVVFDQENNRIGLRSY